MNNLSVVQEVIIWSLPVLFAITVHEVAHGWVARRLGDPTAYMMGRLTLNPLKHIDPIGTVVVPLALVLLEAGFVFGWAKPVPVAWKNLKNPKRDMALVALAGPMANLLMALFWAVVVKIGLLLLATVPFAAEPLIYMGSAGITINVVLMVLNLLPLPPLDGGRIMTGILPNNLAYPFARLEPYGLFILIGLLATGLLGQVIGPPLQWVQLTIMSIFGI
ncbi:site-2 protease family protein [Pseudomonadota bacterium]